MLLCNTPGPVRSAAGWRFVPLHADILLPGLLVEFERAGRACLDCVLIFQNGELGSSNLTALLSGRLVDSMTRLQDF